MIKDYENLLKQLDDLSKVINSFKSEAVQLKLIEIIFNTEKESDQTDNLKEDIKVSPKKKVTPTKKKTSNDSKEGTAKKTSSSKGRPSPLRTIEQLIEEKYFENKKTIGEVVQHCNDHLAVSLKSTDISGILMKMVRDKKLKRFKNPETKQYEYIVY